MTYLLYTVSGIADDPVTEEVSMMTSSNGNICGALMFSVICAGLNGWIDDREAGDLRCYRAHGDVTVMGHQQIMMLI